MMVRGLVLLAVLAIVPTAAGANSDPAALAGNWRVVALDGASVAAGEDGSFVLQDGRVSGRSFCNRYSTSAVVAGTVLTLGPIASTRMACPPPLMARERVFLDILQGVTAARITGSTAELIGASGRTISLRRE
jgi:heat shock protein HslJ